jgi:hypothetical protein
MIIHASIPADDPERVARIIAELWRGTYAPFIVVPAYSLREQAMIAALKSKSARGDERQFPGRCRARVLQRVYFAGSCYEISVSMKTRNSGFRRLLIALQQSRAPGGSTIALMLSRMPDQCSV